MNLLRCVGLSSPVQPPLNAKKSEPSTAAKASFVGVIGGSIAGMGMNLWNSSSLVSKCMRVKFEPSLMDYILGNSSIVENEMCENSHNPIFEGVNQIKQQEIKTFAFAVPYLPLITDIGATCINAYSNGGVGAGIQELKNRVSTLPGQKLLTPVIAYAMGVLARPYVGSLLSSNHPDSVMYRFNPSAHVITKIAASEVLFESVEAVIDNVEKTKGSKKRIGVAAAQVVAIATTDILMMYRTGRTYHSPLEMIVGAGIAIAVYPVANKLSAGICSIGRAVASIF